MQCRLIGLIVLMMAVAACGDDDDVAPDGDADADADDYTIEDLDADDAARQTSLAVSAAGEVGIAYFVLHQRELGTCPIADSGPMLGVDLRWVQGTPGAMAAAEAVDTPFYVNEPKGMTARFSGTTAYIATMGGDVDPNPVRQDYCGANDFVLYSKGGGGWQMDTVVRESGEAPPTAGCDIDGASTYGWVVGRWGALAVDGAGQMVVAWRDIHAGGTLQRDDTVRADLEFASGTPGAWSYGMIDCGFGGGDYTVLAFEPGGGVVAAYYNPESAGVGDQAREGVWIARRADPEWERFRLFQGESGPGVGMAVSTDGTIGVSWYEEQSLRYAQVAPGQPLDTAVKVTASEAAADAGRYSSIVFLSDGRPAIAHYRCQRYGGNDESCDPSYDAPVLSYPVDGLEHPWRSEVIDPSGDGNCGMDTQIALLPDGRLVIAYTCVTYRDDSGVFLGTLRLATRGSP